MARRQSCADRHRASLREQQEVTGASRDVPTMLREALEEHLAVHCPVSVTVEGRIHSL